MFKYKKIEILISVKNLLFVVLLLNRFNYLNELSIFESNRFNYLNELSIFESNRFNYLNELSIFESCFSSYVLFCRENWK